MDDLGFHLLRVRPDRADGQQHGGQTNLPEGTHR